MNDHIPPPGPSDADPDDELSYEDFDDDFVWSDSDDDLEVIDLDALDDEIAFDETEATDDDSAADEEPPAEEHEDDAHSVQPRLPTAIGVPAGKPAHFARPPRRSSRPAAESEPERDAEPEPAAEVEPKAEAAETEQPVPEPVDETPAPEEEAAPEEAAAEAEADAEDAVPAPDAPAARAESPAEAEVIAPPEDETAPDAESEDEAVVTDTAPEPPAAEAPVEEDAAPVGTPGELTPTEAATALDETGATEPAPPEPPPDWVYHLLIALPDELSAQVLELRTAGNIEDMPPPGIALAGSFRTDNLDAVEEQLARWTRNHLPLQLEIAGVLAEVAGQQQYIAAWLLQPQDDLHDAQHNLRRALAPLIQPLPDAHMALQVHLTIGDHVPPRHYPLLIGRMQHEFEPFVWHATDLLLVRKDAGAANGDWEIAERYD